MKKITLFTTTLFLFLSFNLNAQLLQSIDLEGLVIGDVGTDINGVTPGQDGLFTLTNSGGNSDFQIVSIGGVIGQALQIIGSDSPTGSKFVWKDGLSTAWASRTTGNDYIQVEYNFYTGAATTSKNVEDVLLYNSDYSILIAGLRFIPETKEILGLAYFDNAGTLDTFLFNLAASPVILTADTWYRVGFAFNPTNGEVIWRGIDFYSGVMGAATGVDPFEVDLSVLPGTGNAVSSTSYFDNIRVKAEATENLLLSIEDNQISKSIALFPNPANDDINLTIPTDINVTKIEVTDISGRTIKTIGEKNINSPINVSDLSSGLYLLNIYSPIGKATKRFMKN